MSEDSGTRLTVTLGRSGRVVKRSRGEPELDAAFSGSVSGSKRSVKDRLGTSVGDALDDWNHHKNKRHRGEQNQGGSLCDSLNGTYLGRNDLRFKLKQKTESRRFQNDDPSSEIDLRVMLSSKTAQPPIDRSRSYSPEPIFGTRRSMLEPRDTYNDRSPSLEHRPYDTEKQGIREPRDNTRRHIIRDHRDIAGRQNMRELRDGSRRQNIREPEGIYSAGRQSVREPRDYYDVERRSMPHSRAAYSVERERMREPRGAYRDGRPSRLESRDDYGNGRHDVLRPIPSRAGRDVHVTSHARTPYPSWTLDNIRRRSPDRTLDNMRRRSPDRTLDNMRRRSPDRALGNNRLRSPDRTLDNMRRRSPDRTLDNIRRRSPDRTLDNIRRRSPGRTLPSPRARTFSPDRYMEERRRGALMRTHDEGNLNGFRRYEDPSPQRATGSAISKRQSSSAACPPTSAKAAPVSSNFRASNPPTVDGFLQSLGLERYAIHFKAEEVDFNALRQMSDDDLNELGIPMGPRKKILQALSPRTVSKPREARRP